MHLITQQLYPDPELLPAVLLVQSDIGRTVAAQLQALSGTSESNSGDTSVNGAKKYTEGKIAEINATIVSTSGTSTTEAIKLIQTNGKIDSITLGAFDCGTY